MCTLNLQYAWMIKAPEGRTSASMAAVLGGPPLKTPFPGSNQEFWSYEWSKHGTCSLTLLTTQAEYFGAAVNLNTKYEINVSVGSETPLVCFACICMAGSQPLGLNPTNSLAAPVFSSMAMYNALHRRHSSMRASTPGPRGGGPGSAYWMS